MGSPVFQNLNLAHYWAVPKGYSLVQDSTFWSAFAPHKRPAVGALLPHQEYRWKWRGECRTI